MPEDNHVSIMAIISGSSSNIRTSSCVNLFLRHCALKEYIFSGKVSFPFLRIVLCTYLQVSSFMKLKFGLLGLVWWDVHDLTCSDFEPVVWVYCSCFF